MTAAQLYEAAKAEMPSLEADLAQVHVHVYVCRHTGLVFWMVEV